MSTLGITVEDVLRAKSGDYMDKMVEESKKPIPEPVVIEPTGNSIKDKAIDSINTSEQEKTKVLQQNKTRATNYSDNLKSGSSEMIQLKITELDSKLNGVTSILIGITNAVPSWITSAATADPIAPISSTGVIATTKGNVDSAKEHVEFANYKLVEVETGVKELGLDLPPIIETTRNQVDTVRNLLKTIPI